jgi:hypothetical protein
MGALRPLPEGMVERLAPLRPEVRSKAEYQRVQCVWLRATLGLSSRQSAEAPWAGRRVRGARCRPVAFTKAKTRDAINRREAGLMPISHAKRNRSCGLPFWQKRSQGRSSSLLRCSRPRRQDWVTPSITRWSIAPGLGRASGKSSPGPSTRRRMPPSRKNLKKLPDIRQDAVKQAGAHRPGRLMFEDEARFGRLREPRRCWAPKGIRPTVPAQIVREYESAYAGMNPRTPP